MTASKSADIFQQGDLLNNTYRIQLLLGRGGTSEVYKARSDISGRIVAVKALKSEFSTNEDYLMLMTREEDIREVRHDAIVRYYDNQRMPDGQVYLVMDFVDGPALDQKIISGGMSADDLLKIGKRVTEGLVAAHRRNIVHRDLSPDNVILRNDNPSDPVIIDFGIAKDTNPGAETIVGNEFAGKYSYAAPEQLSGQTDARSDIYSLGALLLATFRGEKPNIGNNPMEVVRRKSERLDVTGVPEPLKSVIDKMCDPDPDERFQTAEQVLDAMGGHPSDDEATIIASPSRRYRTAESKHQEKKGMSKLVPIVLVVLAISVGAGGYFSGSFDRWLGSRTPIADPYLLTIAKSESGSPKAVGNVPSELVMSTLANLVTNDGGESNLSVAKGAISDTWGQDVLELVDPLTELDEYQISLNGNTVAITGLTMDGDLRTSIMEEFRTGLPGELNGEIEIIQGPRFLSTTLLEPLLNQFSDCGELSLISPPSIGYGLSDRVVVQGKLANFGSRSGLRDAIAEVAGDRAIVIDAEILSESLCLLETALPKAPSVGIDVKFGFGDRPDPNPSGRYFVGENPVIDVVIPSEMDMGFLWVSVLDVSGNVFHLLPNQNRPDNSVQTLRNGVTGPMSIRVAFSLAEGSGTSKLAFLIDDSTLGKSKIVVLHSDEELFGGIRPTTESAASYASALRDARDAGGLRINSIDSRILTTAQK